MGGASNESARCGSRQCLGAAAVDIRPCGKWRLNAKACSRICLARLVRRDARLRHFRTGGGRNATATRHHPLTARRRTFQTGRQAPCPQPKIPVAGGRNSALATRTMAVDLLRGRVGLHPRYRCCQRLAGTRWRVGLVAGVVACIMSGSLTGIAQDRSCISTP